MIRALSRRVALAGGLVAFSWLGLARPWQGTPRTAIAPRAVAAPVRGEAPAELLAPPHPTVAARPEARELPLRPGEPTAVPLLPRIERAVRTLAATLRTTDFRQPAWDARVRAVADSLGPAAAEATRAWLAEAELEDDARLAACRLLAALQTKAGTRDEPLDAATTARLGEVALARAEDPLAARLAARSLAALGAPADRASLLVSALHADSEDERLAALDALEECTDPRLAAELAVGLPRDDPATPAGLVTLERMVRANPWAFSAGERVFVIEALAALGDGEAGAAPLPPERLAAVLVAWDPGHALAVLARDGNPAPHELVVAFGDDPYRLESLLEEESEGPDIADLVGRVADPLRLSPVTRAVLSETLRLRAELAEEASQRRRAAIGLAHLGDPVAAACLARVARLDPDSSVRNAAVRALGRLDPGRPELHEALERDPSEAVRRTAADVLGEDEAER